MFVPKSFFPCVQLRHNASSFDSVGDGGGGGGDLTSATATPPPPSLVIDPIIGRPRVAAPRCELACPTKKGGGVASSSHRSGGPALHLCAGDGHVAPALSATRAQKRENSEMTSISFLRIIIIIKKHDGNNDIDGMLVASR
ncbi:hypothetical protein NL676_027625 [Syzygium grande]|nr:hypothetical protein NL676_027625 [Syzygium grande]